MLIRRFFEIEQWNMMVMSIYIYLRRAGEGGVAPKNLDAQGWAD